MLPDDRTITNNRKKAGKLIADHAKAIRDTGLPVLSVINDTLEPLSDVTITLSAPVTPQVLKVLFSS